MVEANRHGRSGLLRQSGVAYREASANVRCHAGVVAARVDRAGQDVDETLIGPGHDARSSRMAARLRSVGFTRKSRQRPAQYAAFAHHTESEEADTAVSNARRRSNAAADVCLPCRTLADIGDASRRSSRAMKSAFAATRLRRTASARYESGSW
jgi:hypothetical protein